MEQEVVGSENYDDEEERSLLSLDLRRAFYDIVLLIKGSRSTQGRWLLLKQL